MTTEHASPFPFCEGCDMHHVGPVCHCGESLYLKGTRWQHVHTFGLRSNHTPTPSTR